MTEIVQYEADRFMPAVSIQQAIGRRDAIVAFVQNIMHDGIDFGVIPGAGQKPTLLKPGAERLCSFFGLTPDFDLTKETEDWTGEAHGGEPLFYYRYKCRLLRDGRVVGDGEGTCHSRETKYRWRAADRRCPKCEAAAIKRSKYPPRNQPNAEPGWYCFAKAGGCGAEFAADDSAITGQQTGRQPNPDVADLINTLQKMAQKRAFIAATLIAVNASEFFTQDLDDLAEASYAAPKVDTTTGEIVTNGKKPERPGVTELRRLVNKLKAAGGLVPNFPKPADMSDAEIAAAIATVTELIDAVPTNDRPF